jgi:hypothetical protein
LWGYGIGGVMLIAVAPYPIRGVWDSAEIVHRTHNTVGSVQYLPLWAVPVLCWAHWRRDLSAWRLALTSSLAILIAAVWSGDVFGSASWMPLCTLLVLWPNEAGWRSWLPRIDRLAVLGLASAVLLWWVAIVKSPSFLRLQDVAGSDVHGVRYHYGGMAAASFALAAGATLLTLWPASRTVVLLVAGSTAAVGLAYLVWPEYDSSLAAPWSVMTIAAAALMAPLAFSQWPALQISWRVAARSRSSSSPQRPTTHS